MSVKSDLAEKMRREKARNLRYKKAIHADLNIESITTALYEIWETTSEILYWYTDDGSTQLNELIGDEEETFELRMAFSTLEGDCQQMLEDLENEWVPEFFDDFFGSISMRGGMMLGYDSYEGDYFGLDGGYYESELAQKECAKRLMNHTKAEIIEAYSTCFRIAVNYMGLKSRYDGLKSYIDILNGANTGYLATVKRIEELYEKVADGYVSRQDKQEFDKLVGNMPPEAWLG